MTILSLHNVTRYRDGRPVPDHVSLNIHEREILTLLGPSGCGKTSLLRIIAGLDRADTGSIRQNGHDIGHVPVHKRNFGFMFQDYALFPHMDVRANVAYGLNMQGWDRPRQNARVEELLELVGLGHCAQRDIMDLSGGEKQRVALARSLAPSPALLMLDEPLAALDRSLRDRLGLEIRSIIKKVGIPAIMVTHDRSEAFALSDRMAVMQNGRLLQCDTPAAIFAAPCQSEVATILGLGTLVRSGSLHRALQQDLGTTGVFLIRPDAPDRDRADGLIVQGTVRENIFKGQTCQVLTDIQDQQITFDFPEPQPMGPITLFLRRDRILTLPA